MVSKVSARLELPLVNIRREPEPAPAHIDVAISASTASTHNPPLTPESPPETPPTNDHHLTAT